MIMLILGLKFRLSKATTPHEMRWCNTIHGNRHQRIISLEKVIGYDGLVAYVFTFLAYQLSVMKWNQTPNGEKKPNEDFTKKP